MPNLDTLEPELEIVPVVDDLDTFSVEKSLLRIGFFSAAERGGKSAEKQATLRRSQINIYPDGRQEQQTVTLSCSLGVPNYTDLDKWVAFMRIVEDLRRRLGYVPNPIRFRGYAMLKMLRLTASGANYEALNEWGQRMVATSILSKSVVWFSKARRYADKALTVFQSFSRTGKQDNSGRAEEFEVMLAEWLVENLNSQYTFSEDYAPYLQLKKNIAKAMYGPLWMWFTSTKGAPFQKDYLELCDFLGITPYTAKSRIRTQLSKPLDELTAIGYLAKWEIAHRAMELNRWKIVMHAGPALLKSLRRQKSKVLGPGANLLLGGGEREELIPADEEGLTPEASIALQELVKVGVTKKAALEYIRTNEPSKILDFVDYACYRSQEKRSNIRDRAGFLCYLLNEGAAIPNNFVTRSQRLIQSAQSEKKDRRRQFETESRVEYEAWSRRRAEEALHAKYPGSKLEEKIHQTAEYLRETDMKFARVPRIHQPDAARVALISEVASSVELPSYEEWCKEYPQRTLFSAQ